MQRSGFDCIILNELMKEIRKTKKSLDLCNILRSRKSFTALVCRSLKVMPETKRV